MFLLSHEDEAAAEASAVLLKGLGGAARRLLVECVEQTQMRRKTLSACARALESAGFIFVRDESTVWDEAFVLSAALTGEEALEMLEQMEAERSPQAALTGQG